MFIAIIRAMSQHRKSKQQVHKMEELFIDLGPYSNHTLQQFCQVGVNNKHMV